MNSKVQDRCFIKIFFFIFYTKEVKLRTITVFSAVSRIVQHKSEY